MEALSPEPGDVSSGPECSVLNISLNTHNPLQGRGFRLHFIVKETALEVKELTQGPSCHPAHRWPLSVKGSGCLRGLSGEHFPIRLKKLEFTNSCKKSAQVIVWPFVLLSPIRATS